MGFDKCIFMYPHPRSRYRMDPWLRNSKILPSCNQTPSPPPTLAKPDLFFTSTVLLFLECLVHETIHLTVWACCLSCSKMYLRSTHVMYIWIILLINGIVLYGYSPVYLLIHWLKWHLCCFHFFIIVNKTNRNICMQVFV